MKKILINILIVTLLLIGCGKKDNLNLKIIVPAGSPAISQSYMQYTKPELGKNVSYETSVVQGKDPLISAFTNKDYDIVVAPIELGAQLYNKKSLDYKLGAVVTFGNLFLATSTENDFTLESLAGKDLVFFGKNSAPDIVTQYVIENSGYNDITYLNSTADTQNHLVTNSTAICLIAEPQLTAVKNKVDNIKIIDIQSLYKEKSHKDFYPQAAIFIKNQLISEHKDIVKAYLEKYKESTIQIKEHLENVVDMCVELKYNFTKPVLLDSIPRSNIDFKEYSDLSEELNFYFDLILEKNQNILGGERPNEGFYYKK